MMAGAGLGVLFVVEPANAKTLCLALAIFLAASLVGGFVGFLFGLPRDAPVAVGSPSELRFLVNSNLLKVSDFVTTSIVALTLTQLGRVGPALGSLGASLRDPLGDEPQSEAFAIAIVICGFTGALVLSYLWTTIRMREHLERSEMELKREVRSNRAIQLAVDYIVNKEGTLDAIRLALAALPRAQRDEIRARLKKPENSAMAGRFGEVCNALDAADKAQSDATDATLRAAATLE